MTLFSDICICTHRYTAHAFFYKTNDLGIAGIFPQKCSKCRCGVFKSAKTIVSRRKK